MLVELRADSVLIKGYVNAVERDSRKISSPNGEFVEQVRSGTWKKAIEKREDIAALLNHDWNRKIGSTKDNLILREDNIGLYAELRTTDPDMIEKAKSKRLVGWSFRFIKNKQSWGKADDGTERRYLDDIDLLEVSVLDDTKTPAYYGTSVESRDNEEVNIEQRFLRDTVESVWVEGKTEEEMRKNLEKRLKLLRLELEI
ncbi:MAG: peptidase [Herbinix sp.]|nr:peptidase [Herbinix sp.]